MNTYSEVDILINGAGINGATPFLEIDSNEWDSIMDSQIKAPWMPSFGEHMLKERKGQL